MLTAEDESGNNLLELGEIIGTKITTSTDSVETTRQKGKPVTVTFSDLFKFTGSICYLEKPEGWDLDPCNEDPITKECRYSEAIRVGKEALKVTEETFNADHPYVAITLENMSALYKEIGKKDEAVKLAERAERIRSRYQ